MDFVFEQPQLFIFLPCGLLWNLSLPMHKEHDPGWLYSPLSGFVVYDRLNLSVMRGGEFLWVLVAIDSD